MKWNVKGCLHLSGDSKDIKVLGEVRVDRLGPRDDDKLSGVEVVPHISRINMTKVKEYLKGTAKDNTKVEASTSFYEYID